MGRFVPITVTAVAGAEKPSQFQVTGGKGYYNGNQCWQYKIVYDRPGTYTFTAPSNATCVRTVLVGGGGKPKCFAGGDQGCCSTAGSGGAYSEKCHAITPGSTTFTLVVGRQEQDTTLACNSVAVHTAGGAAGCVPGVATGGDWNSSGGRTGGNCFSSDGSYQCQYTCFAQCCGYCIAYICNPSGTCAGSTPGFVGGASAGSPKNLSGGCSSCVCSYLHTATTGGGAGIGDTICIVPAWHYSCCDCICLTNYCCGGTFACYHYPTSNQGGGGSSARCNYACRSTMHTCTGGYWKSGDGGPGGPDTSATYGWEFEWGYSGACVYPFGIRCGGEHSQPRCACAAPVRLCVLNTEQWDIQNICGTGSPGTGLLACTACYPNSYISTPRPRNSGEGAGTGGFSLFRCGADGISDLGIGQVSSYGFDMMNWQKICQLGICGQCDQAWLMPDGLFPQFITCAGTLGGSGGIGICGYTSKAGKGGGGGQAKSQILCICHGGAFNCCNQASATPLAFPPCLLDQLVSNAGTGMAIIYYREA
jgi:hypothetical protein